MFRTMFVTIVAVAGSAFVLAQANPDKAHPTKDTPRSASSSSISAQDRTFIQDVARDNAQEMEMGRMAEQKASDSMVKSYAQKLVSDHTKANQELEKIASQKGVTIETAAAGKSRSASSHPENDRLSRLSGSEFDRAFVAQMVQDHEKAVKTFEQHQNTSDSDLRNFITMTLPTLRQHLDDARSLQRRLGKG